MKKTFIVMPIGNEEKTIDNTLSRILKLNIPNILLTPVIDDFSEDGSRRIIEDFEKANPDRIKLLHNEQAVGMVSAYLYGFKYALESDARYIIEMDAGDSHMPEQIPLFIAKLDEGYDCVFGSRFVEGGKIVNNPYYRTFISLFGTEIANLCLGTDLRDMTSGFEAFRAEVLDQLDLDSFISSGHFFQTEMRYYCQTFNVTEVPIQYSGSESRFSFRSLLDATLELSRVRRNYNLNILPGIKSPQ